MSILFVKGGTPKGPKSNRMAQTAQELGAYEFQDATAAELASLIKEGTLREFQDFFDKCNKYDVHIVGSRDLVYRSDQVSMLLGLAENGDIFVTRAITKSLGLRAAIIKQQEKELLDEDS